MEWHIDSDRPVYRQLIDQIKIGIIAGVFAPGEKLPSVRELAGQAAVNPNTMQRALAEMEGTGLVYAQRTSGRFITEDIGMIKEVKYGVALKEIEEFLEKMSQLGFTKKDVVQLIGEMEGVQS
ncbi:MAG: GntR family transcriptional regulator [Eubacterium aggregans]|jgi:GntR family transcriptional regulator|uniref:DNA-binding transcriptional regulator YhcF, GntR family n=1 Tax=Eubacterium aggregans TaxID=81409 RepID=A0A1H4D6L7_9FIRM|nr:GntR family transcriptional regulator [Eubacterium aggregans]MDD4691034.1 GntR family transcriptional regulator [Eubacterium aggregans]MEA5072804.1 GntR family transcriptional regulator [Eubacterium aggregans]SEA68166.1 DNA-binding transcriptional regulator YhcF, GntR family [Eubacterium aggregans]